MLPAFLPPLLRPYVKRYDRPYPEMVIYWRARHEHVALLRSQGLTYEKIGERLGVSRERARQMMMSDGLSSGTKIGTS